MKRIALATVALIALFASASAQQIAPGTNPVPGGCAYNSSPPSVTSGQASWLQCDVKGNLLTTPSAAAASTIGITPTDHTVTSATGASQTLMAANTTRHSLTVVNTGSANCGINPTGGTAAIGGAGTLTLYPGGAYSPSIPTLSAVTAICTSGQPLYADDN